MNTYMRQIQQGGKPARQRCSRRCRGGGPLHAAGSLGELVGARAVTWEAAATAAAAGLYAEKCTVSIRAAARRRNSCQGRRQQGGVARRSLQMRARGLIRDEDSHVTELQTDQITGSSRPRWCLPVVSACTSSC